MDIRKRKIELFHNESSLYKMNLKIGNTNVYMKRDDILDFAFGGNKVRLYEYIAFMIKEKKSKKVITFGSVYSNHIRVTAAVASILGIECDLIILKETNEDTTCEGNRRLLEEYNAKLVYCDVDKAHEFIDDYLEAEDKKGTEYFWVPGGGHLKEAAFGYVEAAEEIKKQENGLGVSFDAIFLPTGTGTTHAGLLYGFADTPIYGVTVARSVERCKSEIKNLLCEMQKVDGRTVGNWDEKIHVLENNGMQYGKQDERLDVLRKEVAKSDGVFLDPIYNAKAFYGMKQFLEKNMSFQNVLYVNTGGSPNIFLHDIK